MNTSPDTLNQAFAALADPTRRAIVARLASGEATVNELAAPFNMSQPSISKHLKVLERAGLISRGRAAQTRPCRLEAAPLRQVAGWVDLYRNIWEESFDKLDTFLQSTAPPPLPTAIPNATPPSTKGKKHVLK
ncbi:MULTISPECIES: helix-turn-helix transcriptional regulator [unclassified Polaromonas]|uniref:ArsR/SmtB family transcription factor n=1 Tax=unclassified Polaromonas TaxID=2638319 RepID=UPI000F07980C|nr:MULTISPECIES: metalloregulator ArsR/SmtB family transcription factor [unclassified Polaromonas]AYQ29798.1 transcriptional regulator [Polaromonas sp. SP1]QGJ19085.1 metalloregulator ArsR/SmtB family transcription factor [Polaromonas sp. Pch-P]